MVIRQYDICRLRQRRPNADLVACLQADALDEFATRIVAPLVPEAALPHIHRLRPSIPHNSRRLRLIVDRISVIPVSAIGAVIGNCAERSYEIRRAIDLAFTGS